MKKITDKEILDWLDSRSREHYSWSVSSDMNGNIWISNTVLGGKRIADFRTLMRKVINDEKICYLDDIDCGYGNVYWSHVEDAFEAGKDRGKWEASQWRYTAEEILDLEKDLFHPCYPSISQIRVIVNAARKVRK